MELSRWLKFIFWLTSCSGLGAQIYMLYGEYQEGKSTQINFVKDEFKMMPAVSVCLAWPLIFNRTHLCSKLLLEDDSRNHTQQMRRCLPLLARICGDNLNVINFLHLPSDERSMIDHCYWKLLGHRLFGADNEITVDEIRNEAHHFPHDIIRFKLHAKKDYRVESAYGIEDFSVR